MRYIESLIPSIVGRKTAKQNLSRQSGLCPRALFGASRRVRRGPSLGETASAGVVNSQDTLHVEKTATDDGILRERDPSLSLPALESSITLKRETNEAN